MPQYLEKRRRRWYAVLDVPSDVRGAFGKKRLVQSLGTDSLAQAQIKVHGVVHAWKEQIEAIRATANNPDSLSQVARSQDAWSPDGWRRWIKSVYGNVPRLDWEAEEALEGIAIDMEEDGRAGAILGLRVATGKSVLLSEHVQGYLDDTVPDPKSKDMKTRHLGIFFETFKLAEEVNREAVAEWVKQVLLGDLGISHKTAKTYLSTYRTFWAYLGEKKLVKTSLEAFTDVLRAPLRASKGNGQGRRGYFTPEDYRRLLEAVPENDETLSDLIRIAAHTGCRVEEICSLRLGDVNLGDTIPFFLIRDAKTEAGNRKVPIHSAIRQLVARLKDNSKDGYLLSGLTKNKYGDRSNAIGKRFGRLKSSLGYGRDLVFHSFRRGVATQFENRGVPEVIAARVLGHEFPTMSFGIYSGGADLETLSNAVEVLSWA
jgi:integrase